MMRTLIKYVLYPLLLLATIGAFIISIRYQWNLVYVFGWLAGIRFAILILVEFAFPFKKAWKITRLSFIRDLKYIIMGAILAFGLKFLLGALAIEASKNNTGLLENSPIVIGFLLSALFFEFFQYWYHRISHEGKGKIGSFLWKVHVAHHLPERVYILMHGVLHPLNTIIIFLITQGTLIFMGASQESIFLLNAMMGLHGLISHFNVEIRAGWLNYVFVSTELHRFHHSVKIEEAKNYGVLLPFWDMIFGTFYYQPDRSPTKLGVEDPGNYPKSIDILKIIALPFKRK